MPTRPLIGITAAITKSVHPPHTEMYMIGRKYVDAVEQAGGVPLIVPHNLGEDSLHLLLGRLDGLLLSGGGDIDPAIYGEEPHPDVDGISADRDRVELALARWAVDQSKPLLAICRGIQVLNVSLGGTLVQDIPSQVAGALQHHFEEKTTPRGYLAHPVSIEPGSLLSAVIQSDAASVNSWHHQSLKQVAQPLRVVAESPDGIIEAVEIPGQRFVLGVQWHPEWLFETQPEALRLFTALEQIVNDSMA